MNATKALRCKSPSSRSISSIEGGPKRNLTRLFRTALALREERKSLFGEPRTMITSKKGQAWYVLRGYRYQLLRSLDAWLGLRPGEVLLLETEEDFSVKSATVSFDTQVKSSAAAGGPKSHSLRSKDVHAALG